MAVASGIDSVVAPASPDSTLNYGWGRLLLCYLLPPLLARPLGGRGRGYIKAFLWLDLALLVTNVVIDRGPREGLRRLPEEIGVWPPRQDRHHPLSWATFLTVSALTLTVVTSGFMAFVERASKHPRGRFLNWTPIVVERSLDGSLARFLFGHLPLNIVAEECYLRGLLWSRMAWLGRWRPLVNGTAWAFYHLNRPVKDMLAAILPGALLAGYARAFTGNIYWTAAGHYLSNAFFSWPAYRRLRSQVAMEEDVGVPAAAFAADA
ncbi:MAG: hypothetical protein A2148_03400 [Chloroflexi bacterium RBG_16_68_14]|nr:MAG: hypothetical protein A2148_03400 [Chloroflexi bacterium RBG_16_68_14]